MKKTLFILLLLTLSHTLIDASETDLLNHDNAHQVSTDRQAKVGRNVFRKKLRKRCGFTGAKFAQMHTRNEWQELKDEGNFRIEIYKICPKTATVLKDHWLEPLYEFSIVYASDSGNYPAC